MPYFNVQVTETVNHQFAICAPTRDAVEEILATALVTNKHDHKKIVHVQTNSDSSMSIYDAKKADFDNALKQSKVK